MNFDKNSLLHYLTPDGPERVGFVLSSGEIIEVDNVCHDPENGFEIRASDILEHIDEAVATWHTHPGDFDSNLSMADRTSFLNYPDWRHYIVARDGVSEYFVENGVVFNS